MNRQNGRRVRQGGASGWFSMGGGTRRRRWGVRDMLTILAVVGIVGTVLFVILKPPITPADGLTAGVRPGTRVQTSTGAMSDSDRALLVKVRQAGLWEGPSGQQAQQRAGSAKVREVGNNLAREHMVLDEDVRQVAAQLNVVLPSQPSEQQKGWMTELSKLKGNEFDARFVHLLRAAHGNVFPTIAKVRATTENSVVRAFAERALRTVQRHMTYLEGTGMTDFPKIHKELN